MTTGPAFRLESVKSALQASDLPKMGDGFPAGALHALLGVSLAALVLPAFLRMKKRHRVEE